MQPARPAPVDIGGLGEAGGFFTHRAIITTDPVADALPLPASRGVVVMRGDDSRPVFMAATGDCRALARRKLAPAERGVRAGVDLRSIVREVHAVECGSAFEADLIYLLQARSLMPHAARLVAERWRSWWAQIDPSADFPDWSKTDLGMGLSGGAVAPRSASTAKGMIRDAAGAAGGGCIVGPFADKDAAGRFIERMIDAFDLCRDHRLLVLAPHAQACAYKEMGRCDAPCDGSEPMTSYRARVASAIAAATACDIEARVQQEEAAMRAAAASQDFEAAARHRAQSQRLAKLAGPATSRIAKLEDFRFMLVWRSVKDGWVRIAACERGFVCWLADADVQRLSTKPSADAIDLCRVAAAWTESSSCRAAGPEQVDVLGLLARERVVPDTRRTAWFIPIRPGESPELPARALVRAAAAALKPRRAQPGDSGGARPRMGNPLDSASDAPVHELEAMPEQPQPTPQDP